MDFLLGNKEYPLEAEWFEFNPKATIDDVESWEGGVVFRYKDITRSRNVQEAVQGLRKNVKTLVIETRSKLSFKEQDIVKTELGTYKITQVDHIQDDNFSAKQFLKNINLYKAIITLQ